MFDISDSFRNKVEYLTPYRWYKLNKCFCSSHALALSKNFPFTNYSKSVGRDCRYSLYERTIIDGNKATNTEDLCSNWNSLVQYLLSREYKRSVELALGIDIGVGLLNVRLYRYVSGDWMNPHTDPPDRLTTHLIYLNQDWKKRFGGELAILNWASTDSIEHVVEPIFNTGVLFCPSHESYHAVLPMNTKNGYERLAIIAQFVDPKRNTYQKD